MTQDQALTILKTGINCFLTGEPGSGKSHTINSYVAYLDQHGVEACVTASTGIAATHIDGMTIHSWCGIGIKDVLTDYDIDLISQKEKVVKRVRGASVLIIDEISMLSSTTLSSVDAVCRTLRASTRPFGGIQVVLVGDFFQLPPIVKQGFAQATAEIEYEEPKAPFAFTASVWKRMNPIVCYLTEQHRQEDAKFLEVLTSIRRGAVTKEIQVVLTARNTTPSEGVVHTKLFPHNNNVDQLNDQELLKLPGTARVFQMQSRGAPPLIEGLKRNCLSPATLQLKVGAKVLFTKNSMESEYYNGTVGEVVEFSRTTGRPVVRLKNGHRLEVEPEEWSIMDGQKKLAEITQLPLRLAWAITVHKSQGMSLDTAVIDLTRAFEYGQGYVALSRVRTLQGLYLTGFNERSLMVHPEVLEADEVFREASELAEESFAKLSAKELSLMHASFIQAAGGSVARAPKQAVKEKKFSTYDTTKALLTKKLSLADMARERGVTAGTIISHVEKLYEMGELEPLKDIAHLLPEPKKFVAMKDALEEVLKKEGKMSLTPVKQALGPTFSFEDIRLARLFVK